MKRYISLLLSSTLILTSPGYSAHQVFAAVSKSGSRSRVRSRSFTPSGKIKGFTRSRVNAAGVSRAAERLKNTEIFSQQESRLRPQQDIRRQTLKIERSLSLVHESLKQSIPSSQSHKAAQDLQLRLEGMESRQNPTAVMALSDAGKKNFSPSSKTRDASPGFPPLKPPALSLFEGAGESSWRGQARSWLFLLGAGAAIAASYAVFAHDFGLSSLPFSSPEGATSVALAFAPLVFIKHQKTAPGAFLPSDALKDLDRNGKEYKDLQQALQDGTVMAAPSGYIYAELPSRQGAPAGDDVALSIQEGVRQSNKQLYEEALYHFGHVVDAAAGSKAGQNQEAGTLARQLFMAAASSALIAHAERLSHDPRVAVETAKKYLKESAPRKPSANEFAAIQSLVESIETTYLNDSTVSNPSMARQYVAALKDYLDAVNGDPARQNLRTARNLVLELLSREEPGARLDRNDFAILGSKISMDPSDLDAVIADLADRGYLAKIGKGVWIFIQLHEVEGLKPDHGRRSVEKGAQLLSATSDAKIEAAIASFNRALWDYQKSLEDNYRPEEERDKLRKNLELVGILKDSAEDRLGREYPHHRPSAWKPASGQNSKTPNLDNFSRDLTAMALEGKIAPVTGRSQELDRLMVILGRRT
ncbi:MAG: hypothetical protein HY611_01385, partial [Elusimicrobia bacterium]|nr:hypothetical protein [Elusimicrobiota bacterium]